MGALEEGIFDQEVFDNLEEAAYYVNTERKIISWNKAAEGITGYKREEVVGSHCFNNILMHVDIVGLPLCKERCPLAATMKNGTVNEVDVYLHDKHGHRKKVFVITAPVLDRNNIIIGGAEIFHEKPLRETMLRSLTGVLQRKIFK